MRNGITACLFERQIYTVSQNSGGILNGSFIANSPQILQVKNFENLLGIAKVIDQV